MPFRSHQDTDVAPAGPDAPVISLAVERLRRRRASGARLTGHDYLPLLLADGVDDMVLAEHLARAANALQRHGDAGGAWAPASPGRLR